ncbi:MAG TPA: FAD-dependent oxidoreductase [Rhizobiaceae bacterium]
MRFTEPVWRRSGAALSFAAGLESNRLFDLVVVGGGILGLSTALHAARSGLAVQVLEAKCIGVGASGLNGGQVIPGLKYDPDWLVGHFGPESGEALARFAASTADAVFDLIANEHLAVPFTRNGWIQAAHTQTALKNAESRDRQWRRRGADVQLLDGPEIAALTGTRGYLGGWLDRRAGVIDPLSFSTELARIATEAGVTIAEQQQATKLRQEGGSWRISTLSGFELHARSVVVATNAYSDALVPGLARTLVPLHSFQLATAPLQPGIADAILPEGQAVSDSRRILLYYRKTPDGRFMLGGRGRMALPRHESEWAHLQRAMIRLYPFLCGLPVERRWFGRVAITPDHLPHIHSPEPGLIAVVGCQGRGVGLMTLLGRHLAKHLLTGDPASLPFPVTPIRPIPFHAFRQLGVAAMITWYRTLDAFER